MSIQVYQVRGDIIELIFNPKEVDLHVGENLLIKEIRPTPRRGDGEEQRRLSIAWGIRAGGA
jgi:hypothetical protein